MGLDARVPNPTQIISLRGRRGVGFGTDGLWYTRGVPARQRRSASDPERRAEALCRDLREGRGEAAKAMAALRALGAAAAGPVAALLRERGAGYAFAVRVLAALPGAAAADALAEAAGDPAARECDRLEAAAALLDRGDPRGERALLDLATARDAGLRTSAWYLLDGASRLDPRGVALGPWLDDPETRPLAVAWLVARGVETGGSLDGEAARRRFREGWASGVRRAAPGRRR
jgi:hypothetical protein